MEIFFSSNFLFCFFVMCKFKNKFAIIGQIFDYFTIIDTINLFLRIKILEFYNIDARKLVNF